MISGAQMASASSRTVAAMRLGIRHRLLLHALALGLALCVGAPLVNAASAAPPDVNIVVWNRLGYQQYYGTPGQPLRFGLQIERLDGSFPTPGSFPTDIYFGAIVPGGRVFTWVSNPGGGPVLVEGLIPVARAFTAISFVAERVLGIPEYTFSERDAPGLYSVFVLLVTPGSDPSDGRSWQYARMVPLMFKGAIAPP
jgi:hypothetical protein